MIETILTLFSGGNGFYAIIAGLVGLVLFQARQSGKRSEREKQLKSQAKEEAQINDKIKDNLEIRNRINSGADGDFMSGNKRKYRRD